MTSGNKARITITLRQDLLPLLDKFIDGETIRNRSHAVEYILSQHLGVGIDTAVILAGADKRGAVHTLNLIRNRPAIAYHLDKLKNFGLRNIIFVIDEKGRAVKELVGDGSQWGLRVTYLHDSESGGTARALALAKPLLEDSFVVLYSDSFADINYADLIEYHQETDALGTVALTYKKSPENYGVARVEGSRIVDYSEKPGEDSQHGLVNAGVYVFEPQIFQYISPSTRSLETEVLPKVAAKTILTGYPFQGKWFDISTEQGRLLAEKDL